MSIDDISFLILSYILVSDEEIHSNELQIQQNLFNTNERIQVEHSKILSDDKDKIPLKELLSLFLERAGNQDTENLIKNVFKVIYADGFYHHGERFFLDNIVTQLNISKEKVTIIENDIINYIGDKYIDKKQTFWQNAKESFNKIAYNITGNEKFEGNLLEGQEFVNKIREIGNVAKNDLQIVQSGIEKLDNVLSENYQILKNHIQIIHKNRRNDNESREIISLTNELNQKLGEEITKMLNTNLEMLNKKKRTIDYFTIAFMGRTKAGKSTFHKVITGEETDDIGVGKLRTTRYNRVFNWENIRIVDTPGIGAPGGATDTETARKIVDEADLICYVVTNDAIQETEFNFLSELKEKNKPLFIILNCKNNLEHKLRLKRFLENPLHWKEDNGDKSIKGHIDRIHEMIEKNNYSSDFIEIIPIQLLAAQMSVSRNGEFSTDEIKKLNKGSNIEEYSKKIKQTIFRSGLLKKSQNIIDGSNYYVSQVLDEISSKKEDFEKLLNTLEVKKIDLNKTIKQQKKSTYEKLNSLIVNTHSQIRGSLKSDFANNYYESKDIGKDWKNFIEQRNYYGLLKQEIEVETNHFSKRIKDKVEEVFQDISMEMQYSFNMNIGKQDTTNYKGIFNIGLGAISTTLMILGFANIWNPVGWVSWAIAGTITIAGVLGNLLFDKKNKKIEKAKNNIIENIEPNINEQEKNIRKQVIDNFEENVKNVENNLNSKLNNLIKGISDIISILDTIEKEAKLIHSDFNKYFVFRIFEHLNLIKSVEKFEKENMKIIRKYRDNLLSIHSSIKLNENQITEMKKLLQTKIEIN